MESIIQGIVLGYSVLNKYLILFTHKEGGDDYIYRIAYSADSDVYDVKVLAQGNLGFQLNSYFETLPVYENESIQKVYWVDGINQPRLINIVDKFNISENLNKINFIPLMQLNEDITITNRQSAGGSFPAGTVQYFMSYYNINGAQSKIFYSSPILYSALSDRGAAANTVTNNVFDIDIKNVDKSFDYIRIYSAIRTSENGTPEFKRVVDIKIGSADEYHYVDNNLGGSVEDISILLFTGGDTIIPKTIEQKDNVLFLGNYTLDKKVVDTELKIDLRKGSTFDGYNNKEIKEYNSTGQYPYDNQLDGDSNDISYLKYLEWYRLGVQFQDKFGSWSEAVWLMDKRIDREPRITIVGNGDVDISVGSPIVDIPFSVREKLKNDGWVKMRPLVVFPKPEEREVIAQGIVCPTVYNVEDRYTNSPFVQSSWFARPNLPYDISYTRPYRLNAGDQTESFMSATKDIITNEKYLKAYTYTIDKEDSKDWNFNTNPGPIRSRSIYDGAKWSEFRHDCPIPDDRFENAEIENINNPEDIFISAVSDIDEYIKNNKQNFFIDQSIVTFHSPEIEFGKLDGSDLSNYKFRIIGSAAITGTSSNYSFETESLSQAEVYNANTDLDVDYIKYGDIGSKINIDNISNHGFKGMLSMPTWLDRWYYYGTSQDIEPPRPLSAFTVYPWNSDASLHNQNQINPYNDLVAAKLKDKQLLNLRFAGFNQYFTVDNIWDDSTDYYNGVSDMQIFDSTENVGLRLNAPEGTDLDKITYYGNIDKITLNKNSNYSVFSQFLPTTEKSDADVEITSDFLLGNYMWTEDFNNLLVRYPGKANHPIRFQYKSSSHGVIVLNYMNNKQVILPTHCHATGMNPDYYGIFNLSQSKYRKAVNPACFKPAGTFRFWEPDNLKSTAKDYSKITYWGDRDPRSETATTVVHNKMYRWIKSNNPSDLYGKKPENGDLWYNADLASVYEYLNGAWVTPSGLDFVYTDEYDVTRYFSPDSETSFAPFPDRTQTIQDVLQIDHNYGYFWIGEIYNDNIINRFGGDTDEAMFQNEWVVAGDVTNIEGYDRLIYLAGDTYLQRYDNLKTYTADPTAANSITEIVSFFCETHINIDGRYDRNRGNINNLTITPELFNLLNPAYNQENNLFTYHTIDSTRYNLNTFSNSITWTKTKLFGEEIDNWTKINIVDNIDLDGEKGPLRTITKYNNELFTFQDEGISNILFNSRTQIPSTEFSNIIIGNSNKVDGKYYIAQYGTSNRGSVKSTPNGIYFIDGLTNSIYLFDGKSIRSLSDELGFRDWVGDNVNNKEWSVVGFDNFVTHYDENNDDIYFINKDWCLSYSEYLNQFTSFFSYEHTPHMFNIDGEFFSILNTVEGNSELYHNFAGEYNMFYKNITNTEEPIFQDYYVSVVANQDPLLDKIFTNMEK